MACLSITSTVATITTATTRSGHFTLPISCNPQNITKHSLNLHPASSTSRISPVFRIRAAAADNMTTITEKLGVKVHRNPPESKLAQLGVRNWPKWGCPPSKFPWTYESKETCYLLKGKVKVYPAGSGEDEAVEIGAGDFVEFPKGMSCTWDVSEAVDKHYNFE